MPGIRRGQEHLPRQPTRRRRRLARKCGDGSGKLTAAQLVEHARAAGAVDAVLTGRWESWTWTTTSGRERKQFRTPDGPKVWQTKGGPHPGPADLMFLPAGVPPAPGPVYACEGATDALAVQRLGLSAVGRNNARPSAASLARLDRGASYRVWPDVDDDQAGYRQAVSWAAAATAASAAVAPSGSPAIHGSGRASLHYSRRSRFDRQRA